MPETFFISHDSLFLTPDAPGLDILLDGLRAHRSIRASQAAIAPITLPETDRQWLFCETSGSSGTPKVVRRSPESWQRSFEVNRNLFCLGPDDRYATFGGAGHSLTLYALLEALHIGADVAALGGVMPKRQVHALDTWRITVLYGTPTQLRLLLRGAEAAGIAALPRVRQVLCGGGKLDLALRRSLNALFPEADTREFFGASETSFITLSDRDTPDGTVGRPYPGVSLRIDGTDTGEVWVRSPYLFDGYAEGGSDDTRREGGWLSIGEMGYLDPNGNLVLRGRKRRMVSVADQNVFPEEIERLIAALPGVITCAVLAEPDPMRGHRLACVLQGDADEAGLRHACRTTLGAHTVPQRILRLDNLPLLPAGKPDLTALQALLERAL